MMILLRKARILDPRSKHHGKKLDVAIDKGVIAAIGRNLPTTHKRVKVVESSNLHISPGWLDIGTYNGEPGFEYREDLQSLLKSAQKGGYTSIAPFPTGEPCLDNKGQLLYLLSAVKDEMVNVYPIAALTNNKDGKNISELMDLSKSGAVAFSDGNADLLNNEQLLRSMLYLKTVNGTTIYSASNPGNGQVHEGNASVFMGLEGIPAEREETRINHAITQSEYAETRLVLHNVSTAGWIKRVKSSSNRQNIKVTVPAMNLIYTDCDVETFSLNLKVNPPLRDQSTQKVLLKAITNGAVHAITSNHTPLSLEEKDQPFGMSHMGASTLDCVFPALNTFTTGLPLEDLIYGLSIGPYHTLGIEAPEITETHKAEITVFDPSKEVHLAIKDLKSKSKNNPFLDQKMKGKVLGIINGTKSNI